MIFLSYARDDKERIRPLHERLASCGLDVWIDFNNLLTGHKWKYEIQKVIAHASLFLVFLTKNSINKRGFIQKEVRIALERQNTLLESDIFVIPVRLEECAIPDQLSEYNSVNLFDESDFQSLVESIKSIEAIQVIEKLRTAGIEDNFFVEFSESFESKDPRVSVKIKVVIALRVDNTDAIIPFVTGECSIKESIASFTTRELQQYFHAADPERCYMRFSFSPNEAEDSIENELVKLIRTEITSKYGITVVGVVIKPMETDLSIKFRRLIASPVKFMFDVVPLSSDEKLSFEGEFVVDSVDASGWFSYATRDFDLDELRQHIADYLSSLLSSLLHDPEAGYELRSSQVFLQALVKKTREYIVSTFGLQIRIIYIHRSRVDLEREVSELRHAQKLERPSDRELEGPSDRELEGPSDQEIERLLQLLTPSDE